MGMAWPPQWPTMRAVNRRLRACVTSWGGQTPKHQVSVENDARGVASDLYSRWGASSRRKTHARLVQNERSGFLGEREMTRELS